MTEQTLESLQLAIDTYGADLDNWPEHMQSQAHRIRHDARFEQYRRDVELLDQELLEHFQQAAVAQPGVAPLQANIIDAIQQHSLLQKLLNAFKAHPLAPAIAGLASIALVIALITTSAPNLKEDATFAQWAWEEVLDETPEETVVVIDEEFGFLFTDS